jgi:class 3 adenylate cyclase
MLDAADLVMPETKAAFLNMNVAGREFDEDARTLAAYSLAAEPSDLDGIVALFEAHNGTGEGLAGKAFLAAWSAGLDRTAAAEFGSIIGYLAGLRIVETHCAAGNTDREFVEAASWGFEDAFALRFAQLIHSAALDTPHTVQ